MYIKSLYMYYKGHSQVKQKVLHLHVLIMLNRYVCDIKPEGECFICIIGMNFVSPKKAIMQDTCLATIGMSFAPALLVWWCY